MKVNRLAAAAGVVLSLAAAAPVIALAKHGADDPATHIRGGKGADDPATRIRSGNHADDPAGDTRHGGDDGPNHR